jgi:hypothetical protein
MLTFEIFAKKCESVGLRGQKSDDNKFFVKPAANGAGKVEVNLFSGVYVVGSGSKYLAEITSAVEAAGFVLKKRVKGWTLFEPVNGMGSLDNETICAHVIELVTIVEQVCLSSVPTTSKSTKTKVAKPKVATEAMSEMIAEVRAKNLETMRSVSKRLSKFRVVEDEKEEPVGDYDPQLIKEEIDEVIASNVPFKIRNKAHIAAE